jgi:C4-dicarboxylate transporter DctQ subunit
MLESKLSRIIGKIEVFLVTVSLIGMTLTIFVQVLFRFLSSIMASIQIKFEISSMLLSKSQFYLSSTLMWTEEMARYLMVWAIFIGASMGAKKNVHVGIEAFVSLLPQKFGRYIYLLAGFISTFFCLLICWFGYQVAAQILSRGQTSPAMEMPMVYVYAAVPIGSALMTYHFLQASFYKFKMSKLKKES